MAKLIYKELKLSASPISYFFIASALLTMTPGYPILLGAFFTTLGIFYSFQAMRENNDISYSLLLPISKSDVVKGKFCFTLFIEMCSFILMCILTLVRMAFLSDAPVYTSNALMCANLVFLGFALLIFGLYNYFFVAGFFTTAYYFAGPFVAYCLVSFSVVVIAEALHHIPGLEWISSLGFDNIVLQSVVLAGGASAFVCLTFLSYRKSVRFFEKIDL